MTGTELSPLFVGSAFLAGILSFLSPCVLPLVPVYLGYLTGSTHVEGDMSRGRTMVHALAFIGGFGTIFVALGASVGLIGYLLLDQLPIMLRIGGALLIVMGLHLTGIIRIPFLYMEKRLEMGKTTEPTVWSSVLVGVVFGAGWTPCVGPVLGGILSLAAVSGTALEGAFLLAVYTAGLGIPFLLAALGVEKLLNNMKRIGPWLHRVEIASGVLLIIVGVLIFTDQFTRLNSLFIQFTPEWLVNYL